MEKHQALLEQHGHRVRCYTRSSAELKKMKFGAGLAFFTALYNPGSIRQVKQVLHEFKPDLVHIHNLYPLISPAALSCIHDAGIPIVMTVHNYRLVCPNGLFYNRSGICERCAGGREWNCALQNCEESLPKSIGYALRNGWARVAGQYTENVDAFLCLTAFQRDKLVASGFPAQKCHIIPNFTDIEEAGVPDAAESGERNGFLFIGRLNRQKGIDIIVETARRCPELSFRLAGSVDTSFIDTGSFPKNVTWLGVVGEDEKRRELLKSRALVFASRSYEGFPMVFLEAMQRNLPVVAPRLAGYPEIVREGENGWLFRPEDPDDLAKTLRAISANPAESEAFGARGREILAQDYSCGVWYRDYMQVVTSLIAAKQNKGGLK